MIPFLFLGTTPTLYRSIGGDPGLVSAIPEDRAEEFDRLKEWKRLEEFPEGWPGNRKPPTKATKAKAETTDK